MDVTMNRQLAKRRGFLPVVGTPSHGAKARRSGKQPHPGRKVGCQRNHRRVDAGVSVAAVQWAATVTAGTTRGNASMPPSPTTIA